jgi:hypothetical protein
MIKPTDNRLPDEPADFEESAAGLASENYQNLKFERED